MNKYYENIDLIHLADKVKDLYNNSEIVNYVHNGKKIPPKYEKLVERNFLCSNIEGEKSLKYILTNAIRYSFNQTIKLNTSNEIRVYRETCERSKLQLSSFVRRKQNGELISVEDIEKKEEEIKLLEKKIGEIATQSALKPEINKNILTTAEEVYNLLLRSDKTPCYFYLEVCRKLGHRVNLDQLFPGFRDKDTSNYKKKTQDADDEDYKNYMDMNVKKSMYVPPAFRKEDKKDIKVSRVENLMKRDEHSEQPSQYVEQTTIVEYPSLTVPTIQKKPMGAWATNKLVITAPTSTTTTTTATTTTATTTTATTTPTINVQTSQTVVFSTPVLNTEDFTKSEWDCDWEN